MLFFAFGIRNPDQYRSLGTWGDFAGGVLNPILTTLSFVAILYSLNIQQKDLQATLEEMKRSGDALAEQTFSQRSSLFNSNFFNLLDAFDTYREIITIRYKGAKGDEREQNFFDFLMVEMNEKYVRILKDNNRENEVGEDVALDFKIVADVVTEIEKQHTIKIKNYFKMLTKILTLAYSSADKEFYLLILSVRMTENEQTYIIYSNFAKRLTGGMAFDDTFLRERFDQFPEKLPPI